MITWLLLLLFKITYSLVSAYNTITPQQYQEWRCSSICTDSSLEQHVKGICLQIETNLEDRYQDRTIKSYSKCEGEISVEFQEREHVLTAGYRRKVGICYLSPTVTKCITKGSKENSVYVYSYITDVCRNPQQIEYNFSNPPYTGAFITPLQFIQWKCSSICTSPALKKHLQAICLKVSENVSDRYADEVIKTNSQCEDEIPVEFEMNGGWINQLGFKNTVGMCYVSSAVTKCVTKSAEENSVLVYSYTNNVCNLPEQIDYDFSAIPSTDRKNTEFLNPSSLTANEKEDVKPSKAPQLSNPSNSATSVPIEKEEKTAEKPLSRSPVATISQDSIKKKQGLVCSVLKWIFRWFCK